jgi:SAM-dependent methyltransferase
MREPDDRHAERTDAELHAHNEHLRAAADVQPADHVLDIGCGAGRTTRDAALAAARGGVLGVDVSARQIERARRFTAAEGLRNAIYEVADAQVYDFAPGRYDLAISRFGVMFFADPVAAFRNIARALRFDARLVLLVWQRREYNEWATAIDAALDGPEPPPATADPFSLADRGATERLLSRAGFRRVRFAEVHEPVHYGPDATAALEFVRSFQCTGAALERMDPGTAAGALESLRDMLEAHRSGDRGVVLDSRAWLVTARRR